MPPLGEVPITSYFQINPSSRKRKAKIAYAPPQKKHKNHQVQAPMDSSFLPFRSSTEVKGEEHDPSEYQPASTRIRKGQPQHRFKKTVTPDTSSATIRGNEDAVGSKIRRQSVEFLKSGVSESRPSHPVPEKLSLDAMDCGACDSSCRTPVTSTRQSSRNLADSSLSEENLLSKRDISEVHNSSVCSDMDIFDQIVPSSQTQNVLLCPKLVPPVAREEVQHSPTASKKTEFWHDILDVNDVQPFVMSSQTQLLDPFIDARQQKVFYRPGPPQRTGLAEFIPSSQSQEHELMLPSLEAEIELLEKVTGSIPFPSRANAISENYFSRVVSNNFSSGSIPQSLIDDLFEIDNPAEIPVLAPRHDEELSLTESESEIDTAGARDQLGSSLSASCRPAAYSSHPLHGDRRLLAESEQADSPDGESLPSQCLPEDGSLPPVVKAFQNMFGDFEDSFPPDFPMSLR